MHTIARLRSALPITCCCLLLAGGRTLLEAQEVPATATTAPAAAPAETAGARIELSAQTPPSTGDSRETTPVRPSRRVFSGLYAGLIATQALDVHSTLRALDAGHKEANPMVRWATANPVAFVSFKAAATAGTMFVIERMQRKHPKRAMVLLAALDSAYAIVIAHNYSAPISKR